MDEDEVCWDARVGRVASSQPDFCEFDRMIDFDLTEGLRQFLGLWVPFLTCLVSPSTIHPLHCLPTDFTGSERALRAFSLSI